MRVRLGRWRPTWLTSSATMVTRYTWPTSASVTAIIRDEAVVDPDHIRLRPVRRAEQRRRVERADEPVDRCIRQPEQQVDAQRREHRLAGYDRVRREPSDDDEQPTEHQQQRRDRVGRIAQLRPFMDDDGGGQGDSDQDDARVVHPPLGVGGMQREQERAGQDDCAHHRQDVLVPSHADRRDDQRDHDHDEQQPVAVERPEPLLQRPAAPRAEEPVMARRPNR